MFCTCMDPAAGTFQVTRNFPGYPLARVSERDGQKERKREREREIQRWDKKHRTPDFLILVGNFHTDIVMIITPI